MNVAQDLKQIDQAIVRLGHSRRKLLGQAVEIRKAVKMVINGHPGSEQQIINILEDAAALIECELNMNARD